MSSAIAANPLLGPELQSAQSGDVLVTVVDAPFVVLPKIFEKAAGFPVDFLQNNRNSIELANVLENDGVLVKFLVDKDIEQLLGRFGIRHEITNLLSSGVERVAELESQTLSLVIRQSGNLVFANQFHCQGVTDAVYHILNVYKQLSLDVDTPLEVCSTKELSDMLANYVNVSLSFNINS
ncbi:MAG: DUF3822 family protein [Paludibacteraceae bacterium]|nr:DUF3822 family protein [Paludibacteraceae bacterium]